MRKSFIPVREWGRASSTQFLSQFLEEEKKSVVYQENHNVESRTRNDIVEYFIEREAQRVAQFEGRNV